MSRLCRESRRLEEGGKEGGRVGRREVEKGKGVSPGDDEANNHGLRNGVNQDAEPDHDGRVLVLESPTSLVRFGVGGCW
jgi:hypothetical protein